MMINKVYSTRERYSFDLAINRNLMIIAYLLGFINMSLTAQQMNRPTVFPL